MAWGYCAKCSAEKELSYCNHCGAGLCSYCAKNENYCPKCENRIN